MQIAFCENCGKQTGHKRAVGVGTALGALCTGGASLLAVPAYGKRCIVCGLTVAQANAVSPTLQQKLKTARELKRQGEEEVLRATCRSIGRALGLLYYGMVSIIKSVRG
jgi:hypothetical protein